MSSSTGRWPDLVALAVSGLCLGHCLALPVLAALLPFIGVIAHQEWVHLLFLALAAPASLVALFLTGGWRLRWVRISCAFGLTGLVAGLPWGGAEVAEVIFTSLGSAGLLFAHIFNLRHRSDSTAFGQTESSQVVN